MKLISTIVLAAVLFSCALPAQASAPTQTLPPPAPVIKAPLTKPQVLALIKLYSAKYGVSYTQMEKTVACETAGSYDQNIQSWHKYKSNNSKWGVKAGQREQSFGLVQIHLPDHPSVTLAQATDPEFAIEFMAKNFKAGRGYMWTCWRTYYV